MRVKRVLADVAAWVGKRYGRRGEPDEGEAPARFWDTVLASYREGVRQQCRATYWPGHAAALSIMQVFIPIYVLEDPTAGHCFDVTRFRMTSGRFRYAERVDALRFVQQPSARQLFLLGKIGAGKTTFLKYLALQALDDKLDGLPVYIRLKDWADSGLSLLAFIAQQFALYTDLETHTYVEDRLKEGAVLLLLDGLDEIGQAGDARRRVTERLMNFSELYPTCRYVIACRSTACEYGFEQFTYAEITDFDMDQIRLFVGQWFQDDNEKRDQLIAAFAKEENRALRDLGRTPLHLALLCLNFDVTQSFPGRRFDLYEAAINIMLKRRRLSLDSGPAASVHRDAILEHKRQLFEHVADIAFREGDSLRQAVLEKYLETYLQTDDFYPPGGLYPHFYGVGDEIDGAVILDTIKKDHNIFVQRVPGVYMFAHKTFQNYFMTRYILDHLADDALAQLMQHVTDDHWHEVFRLTASALDDTTAFFDVFRRAIDDLIRGDEGIEDFLWWATQKAKAVIVDVKPPALRGLYCYLDLALACPLALDYDLLRARDLALALARALDRGLALDLALDLGLNLAFALDRDRANIGDRARARTLDRALNRVRDSIRARETTPKIKESIQEALDLSRSMDFLDLQRALTALAIPEDDAPAEIWTSFADEVRRLMITHRGMGRDWSFTKQQSARLAAYLAANYLFVQCLDLASSGRGGVEHRVSLESGLLLPPGG